MSEYVNIKVKVEIRDFLKGIADVLNKSGNSKNKVTVAGLITMFSEKYRKSAVASEIEGSTEEWINLGMPTLVSFPTKKIGTRNESK